MSTTRFILMIFVSCFIVATGIVSSAQGETPSADSKEILNYPGSVPMIEAVERLNQNRGASWLTAEAYHTNDSIKDVIRYFKKGTEKVNRDKPANVILESLMRDNKPFRWITSSKR